MKNIRLSLPIKIPYAVMQQLLETKLTGMEFGTGKRKKGRILGTSMEASPLEEYDILLGLRVVPARKILLPGEVTVYIHGNLQYDPETGQLSVSERLGQAEFLHDLHRLDRLLDRSALEPLGRGAAMASGRSLSIARPACLRVGAIQAIEAHPEVLETRLPDRAADDLAHRFGRTGHELEEHVFEIQRPATDDLPRGHAHDPFVRIIEERTDQLHRRPSAAAHRDAEQAQARVKVALLHVPAAAPGARPA